MRKPRKVAKPKERRHLTLVTNLPTCEDHSCSRSSTVFHRWKWWCDKHDPGETPNPTCGHSNPSPFNDLLLCGWCGGWVGCLWPRKTAT